MYIWSNISECFLSWKRTMHISTCKSRLWSIVSVLWTYWIPNRQPINSHLVHQIIGSNCQHKSRAQLGKLKMTSGRAYLTIDECTMYISCIHVYIYVFNTRLTAVFTVHFQIICSQKRLCRYNYEQCPKSSWTTDITSRRFIFESNFFVGNIINVYGIYTEKITPISSTSRK